MILPKQVNLAEIAYYQHQLDEETEIQTRIIKARELYDGYIDEELAETAGDLYIGSDKTDVEGVNLIAIAVDTTVRRVTLQGFQVISPSEQEEGPEINEQVLTDTTVWVNKFYKQNKLDILSRDIHRWAERDGEAFLILDYDEDFIYQPDPTQTGLVRAFIHERYTDAGTTWKNLQGSGEGCKAHYRNNDVNQSLDMVSKRWVEDYFENDEVKQRQRMTLYINEQGSKQLPDYLPSRIEKYELGEDGSWVQYQDELDEEWPIWWTEGGSDGGASLPLPVIHFRNEQVMPGQKKLWGLQTSMDQQFVAFLNAVLVAGHQLLVAFGFYPTTDGQRPDDDGTNLMTVRPRQILGSPSKSPRDASLDTIPPGAIEPLLQAMDKVAIYASFVGSLPVSNFIFSKAVASSETLKQGDAELVAKINELLGLWSYAWIAVLNAARKFDNTFGDGAMDERSLIIPQFAPPERRDMNHLNKEAAGKREAGVPERQILMEVYNYTAEEAKQFLEENLKEHEQGIGPEVVGMNMNGSNVNGEQRRTAPEEEHGNAASEQPVSSAATP